MRLPLIALSFSVALVSPSATHSQPQAPMRPAPVQSLTACRAITDSAQRLACYDAAAAAFEAAESKGDIVVVDREQAHRVRRQAFGFTLPALDLFQRGEPAEALDTVTLKVESANRGSDGKWLFRLEGGQVWRQIDTGQLHRTPKPGSSITITRAMLGSYKLSHGGGGAIRVRRES